jgi:carbon-monoxide dehydrogenase medium subunit
MIPAPFEYVAAESAEHALMLLAARGDEAKLLAGGHSLLPMMKLRLAQPEWLIDIGGLSELAGVTADGDDLVIGATTRHADLAASALVRADAPLLAYAAAQVGDPQIRHRGTIGGSLAHADPAADLPAVITALDGTLVVTGPGGQREISPAEFFVDSLTTALRPGEVVTAVRVPKLGPGWGFRYEKFQLTAQSWAIVGVAALARRENGHVAEARVGLTNMAAVPVRARAAETAAAGAVASAAGLAAAAAHADEESSPVDDLRAGADYRRHLARVLTGRALAAAAGVS